jgi:glucose-6-phosphate 1-epimerase
MTQTLQELADQFPCRGLTFESGNGGLSKIVIRTPLSSGEVYLHGAHVTSWQPTGHRPVLWLSAASQFAADKPIRGGVPICFPWFGPHPGDASLPAHGFARLAQWSLVNCRNADDGSVVLRLKSTVSPFELEFEVCFGSALRMELQTHLPSQASKQQSFEDALHTYFSVARIQNVSVAGLEATDFIDKVDGGRIHPPAGVPIRFTRETDRVYLDTDAPCLLNDGTRTIEVRKSGSRSTVVWNPWISKAQRMPDFGDEEWQQMVCIETANVGPNAVELSPGETHSTAAEIHVREG